MLMRESSCSLVIFSALSCVFRESSGDCGPEEATVSRVIDGDTVELTTGQKVRLLLVNAPELKGDECWAAEARDFTASLLEAEAVRLTYDAQCRDKYDRLLAFVEVNGRDVSELLVERGCGCVLHIPPNGSDRVERYRELLSTAQAERRGMWGACAEASC